MKRLEELDISPAPWQATCNDAETTTWVFSRATTADVATMCAVKRERCNADARLIAAAPDLYECLHEAVCNYCRDRICWDRYRNECLRKDDEALSSCPGKRWRKALEKAGGAE